MTKQILPAQNRHLNDMTYLLNEIIQTGGTTAHTTLKTPDQINDYYLNSPNKLCTHVTIFEGVVVGFQSLEWSDPNWSGEGALPKDWGIIATFIAAHARGKGLARALFQKTLEAAKTTNMSTIDATIRSDNTLGLSYYSNMGFIDYKTYKNTKLSNGLIIDRVCKRFDII